MRVLELGAPEERLAEALVAAVREGVAVLPMGRVFAIVAAPNRRGAAALDRAKRRRAGKYYSTSQSSSAALAALALPGALHPLAQDALPTLRGALFRIPVAPPGVETAAIHRGLHQALVLPEPLAAVFARVELGIAADVEPALFAHRPNRAVLSTSCNVSGDPEGTIVDPAKAWAFARDAGAALYIDGPTEAGPGFPIVELSGCGWRMVRDGDTASLLASLPPGLERLPDG